MFTKPTPINRNILFILSFFIGAFASVLDANAQTPDELKAIAKWKSVEADNGAVYKVDTEHAKISYSMGTDMNVTVMVYAVEVDQFPRILEFDCHGHYRDLGENLPALQYAPPRSVAGRIAALVCVKPKKPKD